MTAAGCAAAMPARPSHKNAAARFFMNRPSLQFAISPGHGGAILLTENPFGFVCVRLTKPKKFCCKAQTTSHGERSKATREARPSPPHKPRIQTPRQPDIRSALDNRPPIRKYRHLVRPRQKSQRKLVGAHFAQRQQRRLELRQIQRPR